MTTMHDQVVILCDSTKNSHLNRIIFLSCETIIPIFRNILLMSPKEDDCSSQRTHFWSQHPRCNFSVIQSNEWNESSSRNQHQLILYYHTFLNFWKVVQQDRKFRALSKKFDKSKRQNYHDKNMFRSFAKLQFVI